MGERSLWNARGLEYIIHMIESILNGLIFLTEIKTWKLFEHLADAEMLKFDFKLLVQFYYGKDFKSKSASAFTNTPVSNWKQMTKHLVQLDVSTLKRLNIMTTDRWSEKQLTC